RRHTRLQGDWSSDVCSSDLNGAAPARQFRGFFTRGLEAEMAGGARRHPLHLVLCEVRPGPAAAVLRPLLEGHRQRLGEAAEGDEIGRASCRERVERMVGGWC